MTLILILFFISLAGIIIMIERKMAYLKRNQIIMEETIPFESPHMQEIKHATIKKIRKYEYILIASTVRYYLKSSKFIEEKGTLIIQKVKSKLQKNKTDNDGEVLEKQEVSKFLKMVSDYKHKIKKIRHRIKEEEGI